MHCRKCSMAITPTQARCAFCGEPTPGTKQQTELSGMVPVFGGTQYNPGPYGAPPAAPIAPATPAVPRSAVPEPYTPGAAPPASHAVPGPYGTATSTAPSAGAGTSPYASPQAPAAPARPAATVMTRASAPTGERPMGVALIEPGAQPAFAVPLSQRTTIGRDSANALVVAGSSVSGHHGILFLDGAASRYMDTSTNGTRVDGAVVISDVRTIASGCVLVVGDARITIFFNATSTGNAS
jgi:hypothetical protein